MSYSVGTLLGSLAVAFIITRLFYFAQKKFSPDVKRSHAIIFASLFFLLFSTIVGGYGLSHEGQPVFGQAFIQYLPAAVIFLIFDLYRLKSSNEALDSVPHEQESVQIQPTLNSTNAEKNFCSKCGGKIQVSAKFCSDCGTVL
jgi:predicted PurR-regulated permease PerM